MRRMGAMVVQAVTVRARGRERRRLSQVEEAGVGCQDRIHIMSAG